ncbi:putative DNA polymerase epsilon catalytic subunit A [Hibiscus syriacus]|uniref:pectinesterase n=1 Tax=Hibiscus syriacus TaxID=106335 RepID=A0A6A3C5M2_HIBSY|nr:putative DNA polymerase epsilon catalytic subunit A [Hibiscus syriacus]
MAAFIFFLALFTLMASTPPADAAETSAAALLKTVDQSGKGDYEKIQDAIDAVPSNNKEVVFILVKPGVYEEKIVVPADKPFITISGSKANNTIITSSDSGNIIKSATVTLLSSDFVGRYLTIQNTFRKHGVQAVALRVSSDRVAFIGCRILGYQDTLLDETGRHYYYNCYIEGAVDFICGNAASLFEVTFQEPGMAHKYTSKEDRRWSGVSEANINCPYKKNLVVGLRIMWVGGAGRSPARCHLHTVYEEFSAITAQRRQSPSEETGFTFPGSKITGERTAILGRPWGSYSRVVFALTYISNVILPRGWDDWGDASMQSTMFYDEYKCYGPGANTSQRVEWSQKLAPKEVELFLSKSILEAKSWIKPTPKHFKKPFLAISNNSTEHP